MMKTIGTKSNDHHRPARNIPSNIIQVSGSNSDLDQSLARMIKAGLLTVLINFLIPLEHAFLGSVSPFLIGCGVVLSNVLLLLAIVELRQIIAKRLRDNGGGSI
jgi:hypothetical protein